MTNSQGLFNYVQLPAQLFSSADPRKPFSFLGLGQGGGCSKGLSSNALSKCSELLYWGGEGVPGQPWLTDWWAGPVAAAAPGAPEPLVLGVIDGGGFLEAAGVAETGGQVGPS